ncbi:MAG: hypothetical protein ACYDC5_13070, partial [Candidatus Dormibacteria bacterium]
RTEYGPFRLSESVTLEQLMAAENPRAMLLPPEFVLESVPRLDLLASSSVAVQRGQGVWIQRPPVELAPQQPGVATEVRAHGPDGRLLAVGELLGMRFKPTKVLLPLGG